jgi:hypothetical protein
MSKFKAILSFVLFGCLNFASGQSISDNSGKDVFVVRTINKFSTGFQTSSAKITFNSINRYTTSYYRTNPANVHLTKAFHSLGVELSARNITQSYNKFFSSLNQPTVELNIGWIASNVTNINDWHELKSVVALRPWRPRTYDFYLGLFFGNAFINYYNSTDNLLYKTWEKFGRFARGGLKSNLNLYYTPWLVLAINASIDHGKLTDNLKSFQSSVPLVISSSPNVIVDLGKAAGKYGGAIENTFSSRFGFSVPIFMGNLFFDEPNTSKLATTLRRISLVPHYSPFGSVGDTWTQVIGCSINFLGQPYGRKNATIIPGAGFGMDWKTDISEGSNWSSPIYYLYGSINLGSLIPIGTGARKMHTANALR